MCMYNIKLDDNLISETRQRFADEQSMNNWLQHQIESLLIEFNISHQTVRDNARKAIENMRIKSEQNGNSQMSIDDINHEIRLSRLAKKTAP